MLYNGFLNFKPVNETLVCEHFQSVLEVPVHSAVCFSLFSKLKLTGRSFSLMSKFGIEVWKSWKRTQNS